MANQPNSADQYTYIGTVGSVVLKDIETNIRRIIIPGTYVGTVMLYDSATAAGTAATNTVGTYGLPSTAIPQSIECGFRTKKGLVYTATGTPNIVLVWE